MFFFNYRELFCFNADKKENRQNDETKKVKFDSYEKLNGNRTELDPKEMQRDFKQQQHNRKENC